MGARMGARMGADGVTMLFGPGLGWVAEGAVGGTTRGLGLVANAGAGADARGAADWPAGALLAAHGFTNGAGGMTTLARGGAGGALA